MSSQTIIQRYLFPLLLFLSAKSTGFCTEGDELPKKDLRIRNLAQSQTHVSRFNVKLQPAIFWSSLGIEAEYVLTAKFSVALNLIGKLGTTENGNPYNKKAQQNGLLAEVTGRYYIPLSKKNVLYAPTGFYIQISGGYNSIMYFDGSTRPFSLNTRKPPKKDVYGNTYFDEPLPITAGAGAGYQVELLPSKIIANLYLAAQTNFEPTGIFITFYASPSVGFMF